MRRRRVQTLRSLAVHHELPHLVVGYLGLAVITQLLSQTLTMDVVAKQADDFISRAQSGILAFDHGRQLRSRFQQLLLTPVRLAPAGTLTAAAQLGRHVAIAGERVERP